MMAARWADASRWQFSDGLKSVFTDTGIQASVDQDRSKLMTRKKKSTLCGKISVMGRSDIEICAPQIVLISPPFQISTIYSTIYRFIKVVVVSVCFAVDRPRCETVVGGCTGKHKYPPLPRQAADPHRDQTTMGFNPRTWPSPLRVPFSCRSRPFPSLPSALQTRSRRRF